MEGDDDRPEVRTIGRYRLDGELGRGGMGVVYAAYDVQHGRAVALKVISPEIVQDEEFAARFQREARIAVSLEHPHVVPVYETGEEDGALFIAMRRVDGPDLGKVVRDIGALSVERVVRLTRQIGSALDAAHAKGLVHRDVKPGNVLLTGTDDEEHAYLTDFGLAREAASDSGLTNTGQWMGTADYVAPEQIEGGTVSARTDVYSLGCVVFELLTGDIPFTGLLVRKLFAHSQDPLPSIGHVAGPNSGRIDEVLARATEKVPADRFLSAGDLGRALAAAAAGRPAPGNERTVATGAALTGLHSDSLGLAADKRNVTASIGEPPLPSGRVCASDVAPPRPQHDPVVPVQSRAPNASAAPDPTLQPTFGLGSQPRPRRAHLRVLIVAMLVTTASVAVAVVALTAGSKDTPPDPGTTSQARTFHVPTGAVSCRVSASSAMCTVARNATTFSFADGGPARREGSAVISPGAGFEADWSSTVKVGTVLCRIPPKGVRMGVSCKDTDSEHGFEASRHPDRRRVY